MVAKRRLQKKKQKSMTLSHQNQTTSSEAWGLLHFTDLVASDSRTVFPAIAARNVAIIEGASLEERANEDEKGGARNGVSQNSPMQTSKQAEERSNKKCRPETNDI